MELRYAHLADYAAADASGKITVVGIFDLVWNRSREHPIAFPPCYLVACFAASVAEGSMHVLEIRFADADEHDIIAPLRSELQFRPFGPGYPQKAMFVAGFGPETLKVAKAGDYHFALRVDGSEIGRVAVTVLEVPEGA